MLDLWNSTCDCAALCYRFASPRIHTKPHCFRRTLVLLAICTRRRCHQVAYADPFSSARAWCCAVRHVRGQLFFVADHVHPGKHSTTKEPVCHVGGGCGKFRKRKSSILWHTGANMSPGLAWMSGNINKHFRTINIHMDDTADAIGLQDAFDYGWFMVRFLPPPPS